MLLSLYVNIQDEIPYIFRKPVPEGVRSTNFVVIPMRDSNFGYLGHPISICPSTTGSPRAFGHLQPRVAPLARGRNHPACGWSGLLELGSPIRPPAPDSLDAAGAESYHTVPYARKLRLKLTINFSSLSPRK